MLPGHRQVAREHRLAGQQQDDLCGCYWASIMLRANGVDVDAEAVATVAGALLPGGDPFDSVPRGADPRRDYRIELPIAPSPALSGTPIPGLVEAVAVLSLGRYALVPLRTRWNDVTLVRVAELCREHAEWRAVPIANVRTGRLWGSHLALADALAWLEGHDIEPPAPDWDVGHFVCLAATWDGPRRSLIVVRDSYLGFGWDAHHLQPPEALAAALERCDGSEGGIALFAASEFQSEIERVVKDAGFQVSAWDNGTPWFGWEGRT